MAQVKDSLTELVASAVEPLGYELLGVEHLSQGRHSVLRVFLDSPEGITLDDCERASRQISAVLDVEDPIRGQYTLEVSSPGVDRPLFTADHYRRFQGQPVSVRLRMPLDGRRKFSGVIAGVEDDTLILADPESGETWRLALDDIEKANLVPQW